MKKVAGPVKPGSKKTLNRDRHLIDNALRKYLAGLKGPEVLRRAMRYAVLGGGKRLRPILVLESARALGGDAKKALPFACALELIHSFSLVHDDLPSMDDDDFRRGKPSCHKKFGEGIAILAGDGLLNLAFGTLAVAKHPNASKIALVLSEATGSRNMIGGQVLDLEYQRRRSKDKAHERNINRMKTAALMAASCTIGALAARAPKRYARKMHDFGINLGLAFQIADDIRDSSYKGKELAQMRKETSALILKARKTLATMGKKADVLNTIADKVLKRAEL
ncbi:polyprenyl synthetase family protein [Candidatus Omnitrophota bacterium]